MTTLSKSLFGRTVIVIINGALAAAGTIMPALSAEQKASLVANMRNEGVLYHGIEVLGGGAILGGLILTAIGVFVIDRHFAKAAAFAAAGGVLTLFGFMHGERIGITHSPALAISYIAVAGIMLACSKLVAPAAKPAEEPEDHDMLREAAK